MNNSKTRFTIFLCLIACVCFGQSKYDIGAPTDLDKTGWNKVLCMKNGNTMLFHFEINKALLVKVFDSLHKEIASQKYTAGMLSSNLIKDSYFQGLFEVNGQAVLFIDQEHNSKRSLLRLRFNSNNGTLANEDRVSESPSMGTPTDYTIVNNKAENNYAIVFCTDNPTLKKCDLHISYYNTNHDTIKNIQLDVDRKKYDRIAVLGIDAALNGVCVSLALGIKDVTAGAPHNYFSGFFIPKGANSAVRSPVVDLSTDAFPLYEFYTYNPFAGALNTLLFCAKVAGQTAHIRDLFLKVDESDMKLNFSWINHDFVNDYLHKNVDSSKSYEGIPANVFTNENGLSTVIMESVLKEQGLGGAAANSYLGNIAITQYDDDGKEMWGVVLPKLQRYKGNYDFTYIPKKGQTTIMFGDAPDMVYYRQFFSVNTYTRNRNYFVIFNDSKKNINNTIKSPGDTVNSFDNTNTFCYTMNRKKEISKKYLFGEPGADEYLSSFIEGADFDEQRGVYATLVRYKKGDDISLRMAWSHLD